MLPQFGALADTLGALGVRQFRVRHPGEIARIELPVEEFGRAVAAHADLVAGITAAGYRFVTLDLAGFRSGSLNGATPAAFVGPVSYTHLTLPASDLV